MQRALTYLEKAVCISTHLKNSCRRRSHLVAVNFLKTLTYAMQRNKMQCNAIKKNAIKQMQNINFRIHSELQDVNSEY